MFSSMHWRLHHLPLTRSQGKSLKFSTFLLLTSARVTKVHCERDWTGAVLLLHNNILVKRTAFHNADVCSIGLLLTGLLHVIKLLALIKFYNFFRQISFSIGMHLRKQEESHFLQDIILPLALCICQYLQSFLHFYSKLLI